MNVHDELSISFNQDASCACVANRSGISVFSIDSNKIVYTASVGSIRLCRMLFSTSLLAYVGAGEQVTLSPRKLSLLNTKDQQVIQDLKFKSTVLAVRLNMQRLVAVLSDQAKVFALDSLDQLATIETLENAQGICAMTDGPDICLLALPSQSQKGGLQVFNALTCQAVAEIEAHKSPLAALAFNKDGSLIASSSTKGTVVRAFSLPKGTRSHQFRRGSTNATIHSLAFFTDSFLSLLACTSSHGTVHVLRYENTAEVNHGGFLSSVMPSSMTNIVDPQRCLINLRVPAGIPAECALKKFEVKEQSSEDGSNETSHNGEKGQQQPAVQVTLLLITKSGMLYKYRLLGLNKGQTPSTVLLSEQSLVRNSTESVYH